MSELTAKQKTFIEELPKNQWNGTKATIAAGYSEKSAGVMAHRLLKNPVINGPLRSITTRRQRAVMCPASVAFPDALFS